MNLSILKVHYASTGRMDYRLALWSSAILFVLLTLQVLQSEAGECCQDHYDSFGRFHSQTWCPVYCCGSELSGLRCCSTSLYRAPDMHRDRFCSSWFFYSQNIWVPIVIGLLILAIIIGSFICCIRCCCIL